MSLEKEPVVFQVPDFADRFWVYQLGDQRTDTIGGMGKMYDSKPGFYMVVGPDWKGEVPAGINSVFRSPTTLPTSFRVPSSTIPRRIAPLSSPSSTRWVGSDPTSRAPGL